MAKKTTTDRRQITLSNERKEAMAIGRAQTQIVRDYIGAIARQEASKNRGRLNPEKLKGRILEAAQLFQTETDPIRKLDLLKKQREWTEKLQQWRDTEITPELEQAFIDVAADYADRNGYSYTDFRALGVTAAVLRQAGIPLEYGPGTFDVVELFDDEGDEGGDESNNGTKRYKSPAKSRRYASDYRRRAVAMVREQEQIANSHWGACQAVADELNGPRPETVHQWWKKAEAAKADDEPPAP